MKFIYKPLVWLAVQFGYDAKAEQAQASRTDVDLARQQLEHARTELLNAEADSEMKEATAMAYRTRISRLQDYIDRQTLRPDDAPWTRPAPGGNPQPVRGGVGIELADLARSHAELGRGGVVQNKTAKDPIGTKHGHEG